MAFGIKLREQGLLLEEEDNTAGFSGVTMERNEDGFIKLKQVDLIGQLLEALGLDTKLATDNWTPAERDLLVKDEDGEGPQGSFSYSSVVGLLLYLSGHS